MSTFMGQARARALRPVASLPRPRLTIVPGSRRGLRVSRSWHSWSPCSSLAWSDSCCSTRHCSAARTSPTTCSDSPTNCRRRRSGSSRRSPTSVPRSASPTKAQRLGMVPNDSPAFLSLADGKIIGKPVAGVAGRKADIRSNTVPIKPRTGKVAAAWQGPVRARPLVRSRWPNRSLIARTAGDRGQDANGTGEPQQ